MPCNDGGYSPNEMISEKLYRETEAMLCAAISMLEDYYADDLSALESSLREYNPKLALWYQAHTQQEADRVRKEAAKKLNARERRLLGIDVNGIRTSDQSLSKKKKR